MEAYAITKFVRVSPRKVRLVVDQIRGKGVEEALNILKFVPKRSAGIVAKTLRAALANAENTQSVDVDRPGHIRGAGSVQVLADHTPLVVDDHRLASERVDR